MIRTGETSRDDILEPVTEGESRTSAYYSSPVASFLADGPPTILGILTAAHAYDLEVSQRGASVEEIAVLQAALHAIPGTIFLEFDVPRLGSRTDAVLVSGSAIFPIEFKCRESRFHTADYNQVWDYALDLKSFHAPSHDSWARPRDSFERVDLLGSGGAYPPLPAALRRGGARGPQCSEPPQRREPQVVGARSGARDGHGPKTTPLADEPFARQRMHDTLKATAARSTTPRRTLAALRERRSRTTPRRQSRLLGWTGRPKLSR